MNTKLYLSDLANTTTYQEIMDLFSAYGNVVEISLATDRVTGRPLGTGSVKMATPEGARMAIQALHGKNVGTTTLAVSETEPPEKDLPAN